MREERTFRGISARLAVHYLENLGGAEIEADDGVRVVEGEGWRATLTSEKETVGPTLSLTAVTVVFEGEDADEERLDSLVERFAQKAMRAGG